MLKRQLSATYMFDGKVTSDDPRSYEGEERKARQAAINRDLWWSGYASNPCATTPPPGASNMYTLFARSDVVPSLADAFDKTSELPAPGQA